MPRNIFEPSSGGIGIKLKTARTKFTKTIVAAMFKKESGKKLPARFVLMSNPNNTAKAKLEIGPAAATIKSPQRLYFKLYGLYGTGLAQPNTR